jgi:CRISPR-associated protein Cas1
MFEGDCWQTIFVHRLKTMVLVGSVELTPSAINLLCFEKIATFFTTTSGRFKGQLTFDYNKNIFLRQKQFLSLQDKNFCRKTAFFLVKGKISNMATLLGRIKRRDPQGKKKNLNDNIDKIKKLQKGLSHNLEIAQLRGYEGMATKHFFTGIQTGFKGNWNFTKRVRRPPTDPINSVLSFLYTLLMNRVFTAVKISGLDPAVGYLHSLDYGRSSLVLDLMEEFRSIVVETCTLSLFNLKILKPEDFFFIQPEPELEPKPVTTSVLQDHLGDIYENPPAGFMDLEEQNVETQTTATQNQSGGKQPCRLHPEALKLVINSFEEKLTTEFHYLPNDEKITYAEALIEQAKQFRQYLEGKKTEYTPLLMR